MRLPDSISELHSPSNNPNQSARLKKNHSSRPFPAAPSLPLLLLSHLRCITEPPTPLKWQSSLNENAVVVASTMTKAKIPLCHDKNSPPSHLSSTWESAGYDLQPPLDLRTTASFELHWRRWGEDRSLQEER
ncbi:unnamed protein product [Linum trigynum]|uniref:Uncharacterized protein n=1 Tax=Linum trigynum TaxID=586398 RepID=A0AAV2F7Q3_9ROSI